MFAADLVNSLQKYKDLDVMDVSNSESILRLAEKTRQYEQLTKQFKQRYIVDYEKAETVARALGVNYLVFIHGGFDTERDFLKSNWKYRCQWIWANPVKSSALLNINITLVDVKNHNIAFQSSIKKDIAMDNFYQPSQNFGENVIPTSQIKKFTLPNSIKIAQQLHSVMYPFLNEKYSQKDAFIDKYIPDIVSSKLLKNIVSFIIDNDRVNKYFVDINTFAWLYFVKIQKSIYSLAITILIFYNST
mgnify:CR=1 FL=1